MTEQKQWILSYYDLGNIGDALAREATRMEDPISPLFRPPLKPSLPQFTRLESLPSAIAGPLLMLASRRSPRLAFSLACAAAHECWLGCLCALTRHLWRVVDRLGSPRPAFLCPVAHGPRTGHMPPLFALLLLLFPFVGSRLAPLWIGFHQIAQARRDRLLSFGPGQFANTVIGELVQRLQVAGAPDLLCRLPLNACGVATMGRSFRTRRAHLTTYRTVDH